jgi:hypothetical protein
MDDGKFLRLLHINEELIEICRWLNESHNAELLSRINPLTDDLTELIAELSVGKM